jgi:hypothetical protein
LTPIGWDTEIARPSRELVDGRSGSGGLIVSARAGPTPATMLIETAAMTTRKRGLDGIDGSP